MPFTFDLNAPDFRLSHYDNHIQRTLAAMRGQYRNTAAYETMLAQCDTLLYEVYELNRPHAGGELLHGIPIVHPDMVGEAALYKALASGRLRGAALDAFTAEPPAVDKPLLALPNVIATPHMGAHTDGATTAMGRMTLADCLAVLRGEEAYA